MPVMERAYTYDDLADTPDDGRRYEIIGGELFAWPAPPVAHQGILGELFVGLRLFVDANKLGKVYGGLVDVRLSPYNIGQPDILFIARNRLDIQRQASIDGAPDLVVEVLSDRTRAVDLVRKWALYATAGVLEYWIVDPDERSIAVLVLADGQYEEREQRDGLASSSVVAGFEVAVAEVFAHV